MNVLLVITGDTGLQYHRQISPHVVLDNATGNNLYNITATRNFDAYPDEKLKDQQIVYFLRTISMNGKTTDVVKRCHKNDTKVVLDIDDYWDIPHNHTNYLPAVKELVKYNTIEALQQSDLVVTTTDYFNNRIKDHTKKTAVQPNCIDLTQPQWSSDSTTSPQVRFGWCGGLWHDADLELMADSIQYTYQNSKTKNAQIVLGGYTENEYYQNYQRILSANHKGGDSYARVMGTDVNNYGSIYNFFDVSLVPLVANKFNSYKSPLKLVEAGAKNKAVIASNVLPYTTFPKDTYIGIDKTDNKKGWFKAIAQLTNSEQMRLDYASRLNEYCRKEYDARQWAMKRHEIYNNLIK